MSLRSHSTLLPLLFAAFVGLPGPLCAEPAPTADEAKAKAERDAAEAAYARVIRETGGRASPELERELSRDPWTLLRYLDSLEGARVPELEPVLLRDAEVAARYAEEVIKGRWPEAEKVIAAHPRAAAEYARGVLFRPWTEAEPVIFSDGHATAWYHDCFPSRLTPEARRRMESEPWGAALCAETEARRRPELESVILKNPGAAAHYAASVLRARWPEAESVIAGNAEAATGYVASLVKGRWIQGEPALTKNPGELARYLRTPGVNSPEGAVALATMLTEKAEPALFVPALLTVPAASERLTRVPGLRARVYQKVSRPVSRPAIPMPPAADFAHDAESAFFYAEKTGKRFTEGESVLLKSPFYAAKYAQAVLRERWPAAEPAILRDGAAAASYAEEVLGRRWPEAEGAIAKNTWAAVSYATNVLKRRWPEAEPAILRSAAAAERYAERCLHARWPEAEPMLANSGQPACDYVRSVLRAPWPEAEPALFRCWLAEDYIREFCAARRPDLEKSLLHDGKACAEYAAKFRLEDWPEACAALALNSSDALGALLSKLKPGRRPDLEKIILDAHALPAVAAYAEHALRARWPEGEVMLLARRDAPAAVAYAARVLHARWPEAEAFIFQSPGDAASYAAEVVGARVPEIEPLVMRDARAALLYASRVLHARWPEAEPAILGDEYALADYVRELVPVRWPECEEVLSTNTTGLFMDYVTRIAKCRVPVAERLILETNNAYDALRYATEVIRGRWPEAEPLLMRHPNTAAGYAAQILRRRWREAESVILGDARSASGYAVNVLRSRWPEAEAVIRTDPYAASEYAESVLGGRWPEAETVIFSNVSTGLDYAKTHTLARVPELEKTILAESNGMGCAEYAKEQIGGAWPEAEEVIAREATATLRYAEVLGRRFVPGEKAVLRSADTAVDYAAKILKARWPEAEPLIARDASAAVAYAERVIKGPFPAGEAAIAASDRDSTDYAEALGRRFPAGEPVILKNPRSAAAYAAKVLQAPWPEAEPGIIKDSEAAKRYAIEVLKRRWPEAEPLIFSAGNSPFGNHDYDQAFPAAVAARVGADPAVAYAAAEKKGTRDAALERVILKSPYYGMKYAQEVIQGRWPELEAVVIADPGDALRYAEEVIRGRWPEAEPVILRSPDAACAYAEKILKARWPEAEPGIAKLPYLASGYAEAVIKGRWPEAEAAIAKEPLAALHYARCVLKARWPAGEEAVLSEAGTALVYAAEVLHARWPEAEPVIAADARCALHYATLVIDGRWSEGEPAIFKGGYAPLYAIRVLRKRIPDMETAMFSGSSGLIVPYLRAFFTERDEAVEKMLLAAAAKKAGAGWGSAGDLPVYAACALRSPWPEAEPFILKDARASVVYLKTALHRRRWPAYEAQLKSLPEKSDPGASFGAGLFSYASELDPAERLPAELETRLYREIMNGSHYYGRFWWPGAYGAGSAHPEFEKLFLEALASARQKKSADTEEFSGLMRLGLRYALLIRTSRWPAFEKFLPEAGSEPFEYRRYHADLRAWPEFESALKAKGDEFGLKLYHEPSDTATPRTYSTFEKNDAKLSREEARMLFEDPSRAFRYARDVIKGRWPEFERHLMNTGDASETTRDGRRGDAAFSARYRDAWERRIEDERGLSEPVASLYIREIVRGPLPEYEPEFAKVTESAVHYALATRREFPAGEPVILASSKWRHSRHGYASDYILGLLDDPGTKADFKRLFKGPEGARWCREVLRTEERLFGSETSNEPGESLLRARLENRE